MFRSGYFIALETLGISCIIPPLFLTLAICAGIIRLGNITPELRAMPLHLPDFRQDHISSIAFCAVLHVEDQAILGQLPLNAHAEYEISSNDEAVLIVDLEKCEDDPQDVHFHLHVEMSKKEVAEIYDGSQQVSIEELKGRLESLCGFDVIAYIDTRFEVPDNELPRHGMIGTLLGLTTHSCGSQMEVQGASFAMHGDTFTNLNWNHDDDEESIKGLLAGEFTGVIDENTFVRLADLLDDGINCFVLEGSDGDAYRHTDVPPAKKVEG